MVRRPLALPVTAAVVASLSAGAAPGGPACAGRDGVPAAPAATSAPSTTPHRRPVTGQGWLGAKWSISQPATHPYVASLPSSWTFAEIDWCDVEPRPGVLTWDRVDRLVGLASSLGHLTMLKLRTGRCWGTERPDPSLRGVTDGLAAGRETRGQDASTPPVDLTTYLEHVAAVVRHAHELGVRRYAVENEVDLVGAWAADPAAYGPLARAVARVIRATDPDAEVLDSGLSSTSYGIVIAGRQLEQGRPAAALATYRRHFGRRQAGGASRWPPVDDVAELRAVLASEQARRTVKGHAVTRRLVRDGVFDAYQLHAYEQDAALAQVLRLVRREVPRGVPVEGWEIGVAWPGSPSPRAVSDASLTTAMRLVEAGVRPLVHLPVAWTPSPRRQVFQGLTTPGGAILPAGRSWRTLARALADADPSSIRAVGDVGKPVPGAPLVGVRWRSDGRPWALVRATGRPVRLPWPVTRVVRSWVGPDGHEQTWRPAAPRRGLPVGRSPVLVRLAVTP